MYRGPTTLQCGVRGTVSISGDGRLCVWIFDMGLSAAFYAAVMMRCSGRIYGLWGEWLLIVLLGKKSEQHPRFRRYLRN
jgi:hypothetical protein